jgi:GH15 family glucan-1,4-alpha-glucosidase
LRIRGSIGAAPAGTRGQRPSYRFEAWPKETYALSLAVEETSRAGPRAETPPAEEARPAIEDYAIIGDCRTAALVSRDGSLDWLCLQHFSGPSVFAAILDERRGGRFAIRAPGARTRRRYVGASPVLETTFKIDGGAARLTDLIPVVADAGRLQPMREVLRVIEGVEGATTFDILFEPRPDYARRRVRLTRRGALGWACGWGDEILLLHASAPLEPTADGTALTGRVSVNAGEKIHLSLAYMDGDIAAVAPLGAAADARLNDTLLWWEEWTVRCPYDGPYRDAVLRSAVTLKLLTFALSGAVIAAPTASLPEWIGADRNWDYRYCWLRDATLTMRAFTGLGYAEEAQSFLQWLLHATRLTWPKLQVLYDVYGRTNLKEEELGHLEGYRGSRPVRIGNGAHSQTQLDVYGEVVSAAWDFVASGGALQADEAKLLAGFGKTVCRTWREPDHSIWEVRGKKRHYTFSKVMCWSALDSLLKLHERGAVKIDAEKMRRERDAIAEAIETRGWNEAVRSYVGEFDGERVDAALLLMGCLDYKDPRDQRMRSTLARIQERLGRGKLLYRYEKGFDDLGSPEGAFGICSFWAIDNLAKRGEVKAAREAFEEMLLYANDVGLFAEEIDVDTGAALGNFPQAFTHVGLINAALALSRVMRERSDG